MTNTISLPTIRQAVSPMPTGLTPGYLSRAMCQQATKPLGFTKLEQIHLAIEASASQRSVEVDLNDVHICFQAAESSPEGPAGPSILRAL